MAIDLPVIPPSKLKKTKKVDSSIPKWTVFTLCLITVLVVVGITKAIFPLLFFGFILAFIWSQATKPVAQLERDSNQSGKQLNLFYQNQNISRHLKDNIEDEKDRKVA